jgi:hypothetical protein
MSKYAVRRLVLVVLFALGVVIGMLAGRASAAPAHLPVRYTLSSLKNAVTNSSAIWLGVNTTSGTLYRAYHNGPAWISDFEPVSSATRQRDHLSGACMIEYAHPASGTLGHYLIVCQDGQSVKGTWHG